MGEDIAGGEATGLGLMEVGIDAPDTICAGIKSLKFLAFSFALFDFVLSSGIAMILLHQL